MLNQQHHAWLATMLTEELMGLILESIDGFVFLLANRMD